MVDLSASYSPLQGPLCRISLLSTLGPLLTQPITERAGPYQFVVSYDHSNGQEAGGLLAKEQAG